MKVYVLTHLLQFYVLFLGLPTAATSSLAWVLQKIEMIEPPPATASPLARVLKIYLPPSGVLLHITYLRMWVSLPLTMLRRMSTYILISTVVFLVHPPPSAMRLVRVLHTTASQIWVSYWGYDFFLLAPGLVG